MRLIGIDPGLSGAVAWQDGSCLPCAVKMPATEAELWVLIQKLARAPDVAATVEKQGNRAGPRFETDKAGKTTRQPGRGSTANWKLSGNYHQLRAFLLAAGISTEYVDPRIWEKAFGLVFPGKLGLSYEEKKRRHKAKAIKLFPGNKVTLINCDALLLLEYSRQRLGLFTAEPRF